MESIPFFLFDKLQLKYVNYKYTREWLFSSDRAKTKISFIMCFMIILENCGIMF